MVLSTTLLEHFALPANRPHVCVLVEIWISALEYVALSTLPYDSGTRLYDDAITSDVVLAARIGGSHAVGDFDFVSATATTWRTADLRGKPCIVRLGDERWPLAAFEVISSQLVASIKVRDDNLYTAELIETEFKVDAPISVQTNNSVVLPFAVGTIYNAEPVLINEATLLYAIGNSSMTISSVTVRDNGVALALGTNYTLNAAKTLITFVTTPAGRITCDFTVSNTSKIYEATAALLSAAGIPTTSTAMLARLENFIPDDPSIDGLAVSFFAQDPSGVTVKEALDKIMEDAGCILRRDADGLVTISYLNFTNPTYVADIAHINSDDIVIGSLAEVGSEAAYTDVTVEYGQNQVTQAPDALAGSVSLSNKALYGKAYRATLSGTTGYSGSGSSGVLIKSTGLVGATAADREFQRLKRMHDYPRRRWRLQVAAAAIGVREGDVIGIKDILLEPSDGFEKRFIVESVSHSLTTLLSDLEVIEV